MYHAHFENMANPGCYEKVGNEMFKANNLPPPKVPATPQSNLIIAKVTEAMESSTKRTTQQAEQQRQQASQPEQTQGRQAEVAMETDTEKQTPEQAKCKRHHDKRRKPLSKIAGTERGLKIYTTKSRGWAEAPLRKNSL